MAKKVNKNELEQIQDFAKKINNATSRVGQLEMEKHAILHAIHDVQGDFATFQKELKDKYGDVKINMQTGKLESNLEV
jgi:predicted transcriptional regulator|tara:strand:+ start:168 stop:401 length:234 start_codon:yes stop_codon:yes gene_type:complete